MTKLGRDPKSHFDPYKDKADRIAHERGLENKARWGVLKFRSKLESELQGAKLRKTPITLPQVWRTP